MHEKRAPAFLSFWGGICSSQVAVDLFSFVLIITKLYIMNTKSCFITTSFCMTHKSNKRERHSNLHLECTCLSALCNKRKKTNFCFSYIWDTSHYNLLLRHIDYKYFVVRLCSMHISFSNKMFKASVLDCLHSKARWFAIHQRKKVSFQINPNLER